MLQVGIQGTRDGGIVGGADGHLLGKLRLLDGDNGRQDLGQTTGRQGRILVVAVNDGAGILLIDEGSLGSFQEFSILTQRHLAVQSPAAVGYGGRAVGNLRDYNRGLFLRLRCRGFCGDSGFRIGCQDRHAQHLQQQGQAQQQAQGG